MCFIKKSVVFLIVFVLLMPSEGFCLRPKSIYLTSDMSFLRSSSTGVAKLTSSSELSFSNSFC
ncbi:MAG: hypothetical protein ABIB11_01685, partial [Candidatus Omnitrophota bacterium]